MALPHGVVGWSAMIMVFSNHIHLLFSTVNYGNLLYHMVVLLLNRWRQILVWIDVGVCYKYAGKETLYILLSTPWRIFFCGSFLLFMFRVASILSSVYCRLVVTCWEKVDLLALVCDVNCFLSLSHVVSWVRCDT